MHFSIPKLFCHSEVKPHYYSVFVIFNCYLSAVSSTTTLPIFGYSVWFTHRTARMIILTFSISARALGIFSSQTFFPTFSYQVTILCMYYMHHVWFYKLQIKHPSCRHHSEFESDILCGYNWPPSAFGFLSNVWIPSWFWFASGCWLSNILSGFSNCKLVRNCHCFAFPVLVAFVSDIITLKSSAAFWNQTYQLSIRAPSDSFFYKESVIWYWVIVTLIRHLDCFRPALRPKIVRWFFVCFWCCVFVVAVWSPMWTRRQARCGRLNWFGRQGGQFG